MNETSAGMLPAHDDAIVGAGISVSLGRFRRIRIGTICLLGTTFGTTMLPMGAATLLVVPMTTEFGWSRTEFLFGGTLMLWSSALAMPLAGRLSDRLGDRRIVALGTALLAIAVFLLSQQTGSLALFYILSTAVGLAGGTAICYAKTVATLFGRHRGKAMAVFGVESMLALALIPLITNGLLSLGGWRTVFLAFGAILAVIAVLAALMLEDLITPPQAAFETKPQTDSEGYILSAALRDRDFWIMVAAMLLATVPTVGFIQNIVPALIDKGFDRSTAAGTTSFFLLTGLVGSLISGALADRVNSAKIVIPFFVASILATALLSVVTHARGGYPLLLLALASLGCAFFAYRPLGTYFISRYFGLRCFNELTGVYTAIVAVAMGLGPLLTGAIYDATGSYQGAYVMMLAGSLAAACIMLFIGRYRFEVQPPQSGA